MSWVVHILNQTVEAELAALPKDMQVRFGWMVQLIEERGLDRVSEPHVKHLEGRIWEMRLRGASGISRALYVAAIGQRVVVVRAFIKKTQKTPRHEIELAKARAKSVL